MSNRKFSSASQPTVDGGAGGKERQSGTGDSRSFPGNPGNSSSNSPLKAKRSLSDDRGKVASLSALPGQGLLMDEGGKPLLESAWISIVGAAGKFLGRAQERHQWSDARMGMMNRLLCKNKSGTSQRAEDEDTFRYYYGQGMRNSDGPGLTSSNKNSLNSSHADHDMASISNRASPQLPGRASDWGDGAAGLHLRDQRRKESGEVCLPRLSTGQTSASGLGNSGDAVLGFAPEHESLAGRRMGSDGRRRVDEARQSGSGSNSTRLSVPMMPPIPRQQFQPPPPQQQPQLAAEPSGDHLHDLLNKLRARRLGGHEPMDAVNPGPGPQARRGVVHASHEFGAEAPRSDPQGVRRSHATSQAPAGTSRLLGQRYSAQLASDLERQAKPSDVFHSRHSSVITSCACDTVTTNRINSWLAKASPYQADWPTDDSAAPDIANFVIGVRKVLSNCNTNECGTSPRCSPEVGSSAHQSLDAVERDSQLHNSRRITNHGIDSLEVRPADQRPWRSMNGATKDATPADSMDNSLEGQGSLSSRTAAPRVQFVSSRLGGASAVNFKLDER